MKDSKLQGAIENIEKDGEIVAILRKENQGVKYELVFNENLLTPEQLKMLSVGLIIRYDRNTEKLEFLSESLNWI